MKFAYILFKPFFKLFYMAANLSGDDAAFITGSEYVIDGGTNINPIIG